MGVHREGDKFRVSELIKLWVAAIFLKLHMAKNLEEDVEDFCNDLIDRNLIFVSMFGSTWNMKYCKIHDLSRDLCLRKAKKENFINAINVEGLDTSFDLNIHHRIVVHAAIPHRETPLQLLDALQ
ncbi:hypothetical protein RD792_018045 [Penstemon davidsonii]|uniref:Disease resistance protein winged helix domain-containing protein n=1 Tax=Penstemon davidsonii TaxID=160366 RepID=A0ABR0DVL2_9LAMI|nr:hypothetical protein RD792_018045 [Penstemon davidsonii]